MSYGYVGDIYFECSNEHIANSSNELITHRRTVSSEGIVDRGMFLVRLHVEVKEMKNFLPLNFTDRFSVSACCLDTSLVTPSVADPGFGQGGGPRIFFRDFADVVKQILASKANNIIFQYKIIWQF